MSDDSYLNTPDPVVKPPKVVSYSEMERQLDETEEVKREVQRAVYEAVDNVFTLAELTFKLGTQVVGEELQKIKEKYNIGGSKE